MGGWGWGWGGGGVQFPNCALNCLQHEPSGGLGAIVCKLHATQRAPITCNVNKSKEQQKRTDGYLEINCCDVEPPRTAYILRSLVYA